MKRDWKRPRVPIETVSFAPWFLRSRPQAKTTGTVTFLLTKLLLLHTLIHIFRHTLYSLRYSDDLEHVVSVSPCQEQRQ